MITPYHVELDFPRRMLCVTCTGLWTHATMDDFEREIQYAFARYYALGGQSDALLKLIDLRLSAIQNQEVMTRMQDHTQRYGADARRTAILLSESAIQRAQVKRVNPDQNCRFFTDESEALAWLAEAPARLSLAS